MIEAAPQRTWKQRIIAINVMILTPLICVLVGVTLGVIVALWKAAVIWGDAEHVGAWLGIGMVVSTFIYCLAGALIGAVYGLVLGIPLGLVLNIVHDKQARMFWVAGLCLFVILVGGFVTYQGIAFMNYAKLHAAVMEGDLEAVKVEVRGNSKLDRLLMLACFHDEPEIAKYLVEQGADVHCVEAPYRRTPVHVAAAKGHVEVVAVLIKFDGVDIDEPDGKGKTARGLLSMWSRSERVAEFLKTLEPAEAAPAGNTD